MIGSTARRKLLDNLEAKSRNLTNPRRHDFVNLIFYLLKSLIALIVIKKRNVIPATNNLFPSAPRIGIMITNVELTFVVHQDLRKYAGAISGYPHPEIVNTTRLSSYAIASGGIVHLTHIVSSLITIKVLIGKICGRGINRGVT